MTSRDPVAEWMRALAHKEQTVRRAPVAFARHVPAPSTIVFDRASADVSKTRVMSADETRRRFDWRDDLGDAIRMLQRHNKRLRAQFGIDWVEATHAVIGESQRRALPASMMARAVTAGLAREKGDA